MTTFESTPIDDFRIPPGYAAIRVDAVDGTRHYFEAYEGPRKIGEFEWPSEAVEACITDSKTRGWVKSRYDRIGGDDEEEPVPKDGCQRCGKPTEYDGATIRWRCQVCDKRICRGCTLTVPGQGVYFDTTLCSHACWVEAGRPEE